MPLKPTVSDIDKAPETLPVALPQPSAVAQMEEWRSRFSEVSNENFELQAENAALRRRLQTKDAIDSMLGPYANKVYRFLCAYGLGSLALLLLNGFHFRGFTLDTTVMSFVVGSTAVSAIGLVGLVIRGIFGVAGGGDS